MSFIQRFLLGNRVEDDLQVGLFLKNDGTVWLRNPDGSETQVSGGGGSLPAQWTVGANGSLTIAFTDGTRLVLDAFTVSFFDGSNMLRFQFDTNGTLYTLDEAARPKWGSQAGDDGVPREAFWGTDAPTDGDVATSQRLHWYDDTAGAPALRFKEKDALGALSAGRSVGITDDGVISLPGLPTTDPGVADQLWCDTGADNVLKVSQG